ncbi:hypothetical protein PybrP1_008338 [[Pythium] brassicae (nom. inval.)]|nr:hypothetical protein PybrP1_008338 [[Pythium] brassicae (nom. inval.)]
MGIMFSKADEIEQTVPTIGFNMETLQYKNIKFQVWDLGGQTSIRPYWRCYYPNTDAIIYVVDSADTDRLNIAKQELHAMLEEEELKDSILLVFANKQDQKGALNAAQISEAMGLSDIRNRQWSIKETTATEGAGLFDGFDCLGTRTAGWTGVDEQRGPFEAMALHPSSDAVWFGAPETWPAEHCKVLLCISKYARQSPSVRTPETWIRQVALLVLLYEGVDQGALAFDYAPTLVWIAHEGVTERRWLRVSQEAKSVIDDLWEAKLLNGLKLSSVDYQPVTAYQVSGRGMAIAAQIPASLQAAANRFLYPPRSRDELLALQPGEQELLHVRYNGAEFELSSGAYTKVSGITDSEDVSYVSSPYIPSCLRSNSAYRVEPTSNASRAAECAHGHSMMFRDAVESIVLAQVRALVGEWMPFGANQIAALNERLGAMERCQGGLFSAKIDEHPTATHFKVPPGLTQVKILDFDATNFINFEAEIHFPEDDGVIQVENFGMHLHVSGALLYGVTVDAIMHRGEADIPLDLLARLLVDVHQDSSVIIRDLLSRYQISVLDMIFMKKKAERNKYNLLIARAVEPKRAAHKYLDKGACENELKQVLGEIYACYDITREDVLFLGRDGCLFCGPSGPKYESLLTTFMGLNSREIFIRNFFQRTFVLGDALGNLRQLIRDFRRFPDSRAHVKKALSDAAKNTILLIECLQYLLESVEDLELPPVPLELAGVKIYKALQLLERKNSIVTRCKDSIKLIEKLRTQLDILLTKFESISKTKLAEVSSEFDLNIKHMVDTLQTRRRVGRNVEIVRAIFVGNLAFEVVDRLSGGTFGVEVPQWFLDWVKAPLIDPPGLFFVLNLLWFKLVWELLQLWLRRQTLNYEASTVVRAHVDKRIHVGHLRCLLRKKRVQLGAFEFNARRPAMQTYVWTEAAFPFKGAETLVQIVVDEKQEMLRSVRLQVHCAVDASAPVSTRRRSHRLTLLSPATSFRSKLHPAPSLDAMRENNLLEQFTAVLRAEGVYPEKLAPLVRLGTAKNLFAIKDEFESVETARARRRRGGVTKSSGV